MKFVVLALCVYAVSGASFNNNFGYKPWQTPDVRNVQTGNYARATAQVSLPATQTVVEPVVQVEPVVKTVESVEQVYTKVSPVVQSRFAPVPAAKVTAYAKTSNVEEKDVKAEIVRSDTEVNPDGFQYAFETSNGIAASSTGELKKVDNVDTLIVRGQYQYYSPEGVPITVTYVADENGYQPQSELLPVAPPVPVAIARSLEYLRTHQPKEVKNY